MGVNVRIIDEHFGRTRLSIFDLEYPSEIVTVRELITRRVEQEVARINNSEYDPEYTKPEQRMFLASLTKSSPELLLNQNVAKKRKQAVNANNAVKTAIEAFDSGGFLLLVDDRQYERLDDEVRLSPGSEVVFLRLPFLIGG